MGVFNSKPTRSVKLVVDGIDELETRLDDIETKYEELLTVVKALVKQPAPKKAATKKPAAKKKAVK